MAWGTALGTLPRGCRYDTHRLDNPDILIIITNLIPGSIWIPWLDHPACLLHHLCPPADLEDHLMDVRLMETFHYCLIMNMFLGEIYYFNL